MTMRCSLDSLVSATAVSVLAGPPDGGCKCFPGDDCWPSPTSWARLNATVAGRLVATVPLAEPCHDPDYDARAYEALHRHWREPAIHAEESLVMAPLFANRSCDPFSLRSDPCLLGNYVRYVFDAQGPGDVAAVGFATEHNLRLFVRNTGHDYLGRSTGAGALAVWTHHLKAVRVRDCSDERHVGKALELGAGVQGSEALAAARDAGLVVVTGSCSSVGLVGGYIQGGGHSALSTVFGLAADNALSFDVTPAGRFVTASPTTHPELSWALSGGGGNYDVFVSATVKAHPDAVVSGASLKLSVRPGDHEAVFKAAEAFHAALPGIVDAGIMIIYSFSRHSFGSLAMTEYNMTKPQACKILEPFLDATAALGLSMETNLTDFLRYCDHFLHYFGSNAGGALQVGVSLYGRRLVPRSALASFSPTVRRLAEMDATMIGVGLDVSPRSGPPVTRKAVLPQWCRTIVLAVFTLPWSFDEPLGLMAATQDRITRELQPVIEAATSGSGAYMNEAGFQQPDFQEAFFGENYPSLLHVKKKYDPRGLFYVTVGVGSEEWLVRADGRLYRAAYNGRTFQRHDAMPAEYL